MNDVFSFSFGVLAHGIEISRNGGIGLLIVMTFYVFMLFVFKKTVGIPRGLIVSSIIPYFLVLISILQISFEWQVPEVIGFICFFTAFFVSFPLLFICGTWAVFFGVSYFIDTLIIFGIIRLILFIKNKISAKKSQMRTTNETH